MKGKAASPQALAAEALRAAKRVIIGVHPRADGDALGSMVALALALRALGGQVKMYSPDGVSPMYRFLPLAGEVSDLVAAADVEAADAVVLLDCDGAARTAALEGLLARAKRVVDIDHHERERAFGDVQWVEPERAAVAEMVYVLLLEMGIGITGEMATALLAGIYVDTGSLRYRNTKAHTYRICAELVERGARPEEVSTWLYEVRSYGGLRLLGAVLQRAKVDPESAIMWSALPHQTFVECGASPDDMEGVIDLLRGHRDSRVALLAYEREDGVVKVSLRSKAALDVSEVAQLWGGGGHAAAAGFERDAPMQQVVEDALIELRARLTGSS